MANQLSIAVEPNAAVTSYIVTLHDHTGRVIRLNPAKFKLYAGPEAVFKGTSIAKVADFEGRPSFGCSVNITPAGGGCRLWVSFALDATPLETVLKADDEHPIVTNETITK